MTLSLRAWRRILGLLSMLPLALPVDPRAASGHLCFATPSPRGIHRLQRTLMRGYHPSGLTMTSGYEGTNPYRVGLQQERRLDSGTGHTALKIRIMEEVVRLAADPGLEYRGKVATVQKLVDKLKEMQEIAVLEKSRKAHANSESGLFRARETLDLLEEARVVAVIRGGHPERMLARGMELAFMDGCSAIEVALDSPGALKVLAELSRVLAPNVIVGAATVMSPKQACAAARCGARFVTSPTNPTGLTAAAHSEGVLSIPGGMTPSEIHAILSGGALAAKIFPAGAYTPAALSQVLAVGPFRNAKIMISGGVSPSDLDAWTRAGASFVAMGGALVGKDLSIESPPGPEMSTAEEDWEQRGRHEASQFFATLSLRQL